MIKEKKGFARGMGVSPLVLRLFAALVAVAVAAGLRIWPLEALELRIPWLTFYPAVMAAALSERVVHTSS